MTLIISVGLNVPRVVENSSVTTHTTQIFALQKVLTVMASLSASVFHRYRRDDNAAVIVDRPVQRPSQSNTDRPFIPGHPNPNSVDLPVIPDYPSNNDRPFVPGHPNPNSVDLPVIPDYPSNNDRPFVPGHPNPNSVDLPVIPDYPSNNDRPFVPGHPNPNSNNPDLPVIPDYPPSNDRPFIPGHPNPKPSTGGSGSGHSTGSAIGSSRYWEQQPADSRTVVTSIGRSVN